MKKAVSLMVVIALALLCVALFGQDAKKGAAVYANAKPACKTCHSIAGQGGKLGTLDGVGAKLTADQIKKWVLTPKDAKAGSKMLTAYGPDKISDGDLEDLTAYLLTLKK